MDQLAVIVKIVPAAAHLTPDLMQELLNAELVIIAMTIVPEGKNLFPALLPRKEFV